MAKTSEMDRNSRYLRNEYSIGDSVWPIGQAVRLLTEEITDIPTMPNVTQRSILIPSNPRPKLPPAKRCIYCGAESYDPNGTPLAKEHLIPEALGGTIYLENASCQRCEGFTKFEASVISRTFDPVRKAFNIRSKRGKIRKEKFPISFTHGTDDDVRNVHISSHPTILILPILLPPHCLMSDILPSAGAFGVYLYNVNVSPDTLNSEVGTSIASPVVDTFKFSQMLAKIAHSYMCSQFKPDAFEPLLVPLIQRTITKTENDDSRYSFIGGEPSEEPATENLHELGIGLFDFEKTGTTYICVRIRLFAQFGAPAYYVLPGTLVSQHP